MRLQMPWGTFEMPITIHVMPCDELGVALSGHISHVCCECQPVPGDKTRDGYQIYVHRHDS
jgi:hypothetical protein